MKRVWLIVNAASRCAVIHTLRSSGETIVLDFVRRAIVARYEHYIGTIHVACHNLVGLLEKTPNRHEAIRSGCSFNKKSVPGQQHQLLDGVFLLP
jgi:hypothetical protein